LREEPAALLRGLDQPGDTLVGKYRLEYVLGQGGMGTVWRARNVALDSPVALKVLSAAVDSPALRQRLLLEARAAAKLAHPAIVKVFDVDETERGEPFIVMELLSGTSLGGVLAQNGCLEATRVVQLLLPIADALRHAHGKGLVHRDVKPDNIFIVEEEGSLQPKLVDFGIVKVQQDHGGGNLTRAGDVMGSPDYMSPEQARGDAEITHSSDIWALSVVLYEAIAGHPPFSARNYNALLWEILKRTPQTLRELALVDEGLSAIVMRGLSKQPAERFSSMRELGSALAEWLVKQGVKEDACGTAVDRKWLTSGSDPKDTGGPRSSPWGAEAPSGMRAKQQHTPATASAMTIIGAAHSRTSNRPRFGKWAAFVASVAAAALAASVFFTLSSPKTSPIEAAPQVPAAAALRAATLAEPVVAEPSANASPEIIAPEAPSLENDSDSEPPTSARKAPKRLPRKRFAPRKTSKEKKDLLNPY
jgi:serine/threonine-protein kinase